MKDLLSLSVKGLFGRFNYDIDFQANDGFTILAAPNSFGKSTILKLIKATFRGNALYFYPVAFEEVNFRFRETSDESDGGDEKIIDLQVKRISGKDPVIQFNYLGKSFSLAESTVRQIESYVDENLKNVERFSGNGETCAWWMRKNQDDGDILNVADIVTCFGEGHYAEIMEKYIPWMGEFQKDIQGQIFYFVKGLYNSLDCISSFFSPIGMRAVVAGMLNRAYSELHDGVDELADQSAMVAEKAMKSFMMEKDHSTRRLFNHVMSYWAETMDLYTKSSDFLCPVFDSSDEGYASLASTKPNIADDRKELMLKNVIIAGWRRMWEESFGEIYDRLSTIAQVLNKMLFFKKIRFGGENSMEILDSASGKILPMQSLSSGEEQIIATLGVILFDRDSASRSQLIIMDEPETSLHPAWQESLVDFCYKANQKYGQHFIFASHSPIFMGNYTDHVVDLYKQGIKGN